MISNRVMLQNPAPIKNVAEAPTLSHNQPAIILAANKAMPLAKLKKPPD